VHQYTGLLQTDLCIRWQQVRDLKHMPEARSLLPSARCIIVRISRPERRSFQSPLGSHG
jgi:hypothetical protein